jgi:tetratricopeptide (TPR) repeat protein
VSHVAILWAGNPDMLSTFNDISSEYNALKGLWENNGSIEVLFGNGKTNSVGAALPADWNAQAATSTNFDKAIALASSSRWTAEQRRKFDRFGLQGNAAVAEGRGDSKAAKAALEGWLELELANALARQRLATALFGLGQHKAAYHELQRAANDDSTLEPAAITMGELYNNAGNPKKAQEWMEYAVKIAPESPAVRIGLVAWLLEQGRADLAQEQAAKAEKLDAKSHKARRLLSWLGSKPTGGMPRSHDHCSRRPWAHRDSSSPARMPGSGSTGWRWHRSRSEQE